MTAESVKLVGGLDDQTRLRATVENCMLARHVQTVCDEYRMLLLVRYSGWIMKATAFVNEILKHGHRLKLHRT